MTITERISFERVSRVVRVLGLDPGRRMGWGILDDGTFVASGLVEATHKNRCTSLSFTALSLQTILHMYLPDVLVVEQVLGYKGALAKVSLAQCVGIVIEHSAGRPIYELHPSTWKVVVLGNHHASKEDAVSHVRQKHPPMAMYDENTCEALCIAEGFFLAPERCNMLVKASTYFAESKKGDSLCQPGLGNGKKR